MENFPELKQPHYRDLTNSLEFAELRDRAHMLNENFDQLSQPKDEEGARDIDTIGEQLVEMDELVNPNDQPDLAFITASAYAYFPEDGIEVGGQVELWDKPLALCDVDMYAIDEEMRVAVRFYDEVAEQHYVAEPEGILRLQILEQIHTEDINALMHRYLGEFIQHSQMSDKYSAGNEDQYEILYAIQRECSNAVVAALADKTVDVETLGYYEAMTENDELLSLDFHDQTNVDEEERLSLMGEVKGARIAENDFLCLEIENEDTPGRRYLVPLHLIISVETEEI